MAFLIFIQNYLEEVYNQNLVNEWTSVRDSKLHEGRDPHGTSWLLSEQCVWYLVKN